MQFDTVNWLYKSIVLFAIKNNTNKLVLSGGDPLSEHNREFTKQLLIYNNYFDICVYTGNQVSDVRQMGVYGFKYIKCGKFQNDKFQQQTKTDEYMTLSSTNQKLYDSEYNLVSSNGIITFDSEYGIPVNV